MTSKDLIATNKCYYVSMDYRATIEELITGGNIDIMVRPELISTFTSSNIPPIMRKSSNRFSQEVPISLISFMKPVGTEEAFREIKKLGLIPADIFDLLTLNKTYPASPGIKKAYSLQNSSIISLGTLFPYKHDGKPVVKAKLAPILACEETDRDPLRRRHLRLNLTKFIDDITGLVKETDDWWPIATKFACKLAR